MLRITDIKTVITAPDGINLVVVKVETNEPGIYGLGCATYTQRCKAVVHVIDQYFTPLLVGRDPSNIEDIWKLCHVNGYWRNGPILNNAVSGIDMALWDIKGKIANLPVYQLLGGKCREGVSAYVHTNALTKEELLEKVQIQMELGYRYVRCQQGSYGGGEVKKNLPDKAPEGIYYDPKQYIRNTVEMLEYIRLYAGAELEIIHDVHERLYPIDAVQIAKQVEPYRLFFLEDVFSPEAGAWCKILRQQCATPIAIGELFNHPSEWVNLISERLIDFIRIHISQAGGITAAKKIANYAEIFQIRTAWHGPGDLSPVGQAANIHLDVCTPNFGVQEWTPCSEKMLEVFEGVPTCKNGCIFPNDKPGLGIVLHEDFAKKYPHRDEVVKWTQSRLLDGTLFTP